jgi:hypothetical protein
MQEGMSTDPIKSPWQGAANLAKSLLGGYEIGQLDEADRRKEATVRGAIDNFPGMGGNSVASALAGPAPEMPQVPASPPTRPPGMIPGYNGEPARPKVASSASVMGDDEAIKAGLYEGSPSPGKPPPAPIAPQAAPPTQVAQAAPPAPTRAPPAIPDEVRQKIRALWQNPETRGLAAQLAMEYGKPQTPKYNIHQREDGAVIATNEADPRDMHVIKPPGAAAEIAGFKGDVKRAEQVGEGRGKAEVSLGPDIDAANLALKTVKDLREHPGKTTGWLGAGGQLIGGVPSTDSRGFFGLLKQAKGQVFAQAFAALKGGGPISNTEGTKYESGLARLDAAQSSKDFDTALNDIEDVFKTIRDRRMAQARGIPSAPTSGTGAPRDPLGFR